MLQSSKKFINLSNFGNYERTEYLTDNNIFPTELTKTFFLLNSFKNWFLQINTEFKQVPHS